jgi:putative DNA primase/helicase
LKDATSTPETIRGWWKRWPLANLGLLTGPLSGFFVVDVDGAKGEQSVIELAKKGCSLPDTHSVRTGGGGSHFYFNWPDNQDVRNSQSKIAPGLDIRGDGGRRTPKCPRQRCDL